MTASPAPAARRRLGPGLALVIPLGLAVAATWRVLAGPFQFDDLIFVTENLAVKDLDRFLAGPLWHDLLAGQRPLTSLTFALNYAYGQLEPWNFHVTNLILHLAAVLLAWLAARALLRLAGAPRAEGLAVAAAGLFALHPMQSQAVSYIAQRAEVLASICYLGGLLLLLSADRRGLGWRAAPRWLGAGLAFVAGYGFKPIVVTLPAAWLLAVALLPGPAAREERLPWRARLLALAAFLAAAAAVAVTTLGALRGIDAGFSIPGLTPWRYLLSELGVVATYLRLLLWPAGQCVDWNLAPASSLLEPSVLLPGLLLLALFAGAAALAWRARHAEGPGGAAARVAGFGVLWFFLLLSTTSSVVPLVDLLMEHRVYLPSLGLFLAAAVGLERLLAAAAPRVQGWAGPALTAAAWLACAGALHARNAVWETPVALWTDAVEKVPSNGRAWANLAAALETDGRFAEEATVLRRGLAWAEGIPVGTLSRMYAQLGGALNHLGRLEEAERALAQGTALFPFDAILIENRAINLLALRRYDEAEAALGGLTAGHAPQPAALTILGRVRLARGDAAGALRLLDRAIALDPDPASPHLHRARAIGALGRRDEACMHLRLVALRRNPALEEEINRAAAELRCR